MSPLALGAVLALPAASFPYSYYSASSVGSDGTVYAWTFTDGTPNPGYTYTHTAYATTTLTSPTGRKASSSRMSGINTVRADTSLSFAANDLGTYTTTGSSDVFCNIMGWFILRAVSQSTTTLPYVTLSLRTTGSISFDNSALNEYVSLLGYDTLGTFFSQGTGNYLWRTGAEIDGHVFPSFYTGLIILQRKITQSDLYNGSTLVPPVITNQADTSESILEDQDPQSGNSGGIVYDLDAPGIGSIPANPVGQIWRRRDNYVEWATLSDGATVVSGNLYWFSRHSIIKTSGGDQKQTDIPNDNIAGPGQTALTWNLQ